MLFNNICFSFKTWLEEMPLRYKNTKEHKVFTFKDINFEYRLLLGEWNSVDVQIIKVLWVEN